MRPASTAAAPPSSTLKPPYRRVNKPSPTDLGSGIEQIFSAIWRDLPYAVALLDERGRYRMVNDSFCRLVGMGRTRLIGRTFSVVLKRGAERRKSIRTYGRLIDRKKSHEFEVRRLRLWNDATIDVELSFSCIDLPDETVLALAIVRDITNRRKAEKALKESEERFRGLFENALQGMFQTTPEGQLVFANRALLRLLGYSSLDELRGLDLAQAVYCNPQDRNRLRARLEREGMCAGIELQLKRKDGTLITVLEHSRAIKDRSGHVKLFEGIVEDITERKRLEAELRSTIDALEQSRERLKRLNAQKDKYLSILSHDLRSPLISIVGIAEILLSEGNRLNPDERTEFLTHIKEAAEQQIALVNKVLEWSRLEAGHLRLQMRDVDLRQIVRSSIRAHLGIAHAKDILLYSSLRPGLNIVGDEQLLVQLFNNLISNALKYTPSKGVIAVQLLEESEDALVIGVTDTGVGMEKNTMERLFRIGETVSTLGLMGEKGTGLGLPLCDEIMQSHGGSIEVESVPQLGTTFRLRFPRHKSDPEVQQQQSLASGDRTILVVDDDRAIRTLHKRLLMREFPGVNIVEAEDGLEALTKACEFRPWLILSDYRMPVMNGAQLLRALKTNEHTKQIPVVMVTANDSPKTVKDLYDAGAAEVLEKPLPIDRIGEILSHLDTAASQSLPLAV